MWGETIVYTYEPIHDQTNKMSCNSEMTQISLGIHRLISLPMSECRTNVSIASPGLENSTRLLVFTSASGWRAIENFNISSEN